MSDWRNVKLGDHVSLRGGFGFPERFQGGRDLEIPFYKVSDMSLNGNERHLGQSNNSVSRSLAGSQGWRTIPPGSVAFAKVGAALLLNRRRILKWESLVDNNMMAAVAGEEVDSKWLYWWLQLVDFAVFVQPGALPSVNQGQLSALSLSLPPLPEQQLIASILDTVDEVIRKTEEVIAKLQQMKQGLLHDLLTRGIDDNGELRDPDRHPEQFKDSPLGRIPKDWEVEPLGTLGSSRMTNGVFKQPERVGAGPRLVNVGDLYGELGVSLGACERFDADRSELARFQVATGDVFFTRSSLNLRGIAHCNVIREIEEPAVFECHVMRVRPRTDVVDGVFLAAWCRSPFARSFFMGRAKQVTMTTISQPDVSPLPTPVPPIVEQVECVRRLDSLLRRISAEQAELAKLRLLKSGLMDDLLTGRVRVTDLLPTATP